MKNIIGRASIIVVLLCSSCANQPREENLSATVDKVTESVRGLVPADVQEKLDAAQIKAKERIVYYTMADVQSAVEQWCVDHNGQYPITIDNNMNDYLLRSMNKNDLLPAEYMPGKGIVNPFTKQPEWPKNGNISDVMLVRRSDPPAIPPGQLQYSQVLNGKHCAILGGGADGKALPDRFHQPQGFKTEVMSDVFDLK